MLTYSDVCSGDSIDGCRLGHLDRFLRNQVCDLVQATCYLLPVVLWPTLLHALSACYLLPVVRGYLHVLCCGCVKLLARVVLLLRVVCCCLCLLMLCLCCTHASPLLYTLPSSHLVPVYIYNILCIYYIITHSHTHTHTHTHTTVAYRRVMHEGDGYGADV